MDLVHATDQDGNVLEVIEPSEDWDMLLVRVTDENGIPVGVFISPEVAATLEAVFGSFTKRVAE